MAQLTIQQVFNLALQHHRSGRLAQAQQMYGQILAQQPNHVEALRWLGILAAQTGHGDAAVELIGRAAALRPSDAALHSDLGNALGGAGRLDEAIAAYRRAIALNPGVAQIHYNLGLALKRHGQLDEAIAAYRQAIAVNGDYAEAHANLGNALGDQGRLEEAIAAHRQAIAVKPDFFQAHYNLGTALGDQGRLEEAIAAYRQAISLRPDYAQAHCSLGKALKDKGQVEEAIAAYRQAIALKGDFAEAHCNLGNALKEQRQLHEAIAAYRQAISLKPDYAEAHCNLGNAFKEQGHLDEAVAAYQQAIALKADFPEAYCDLGNALLGQGQLDEAIAAYRQAIALKPDYTEAHNNLGTACKDQGQLDQALDCYRQAIALKPQYAAAHSNICFTVYYHPGYDTRSILAELRRWAQCHEQPLAGEVRPAGNEASGERRLKIGYVSPDFRSHPVGRLCVPLLAHHDHQQFEIFGYSDVGRKDAITQRLQGYCDHWQEVRKLGDAELAEKIRGDGIDILVDLAGHTAGNRLLVFARKPAPVQVTWVFNGPTGLSHIDYRLTDRYFDPPGEEDDGPGERPVRLPHCVFCYEPIDVMPPVSALPMTQAGHVTFGCFNNFAKINAPTVQLWIRILSALPASRLILQCPPGGARQSLKHLFTAGGIDGDRLELVGKTASKLDYFEQYHKVDLCLDPMPYTGHTINFDALWMGVPVVTLAGATVLGRAGASILSNLGLGELVAATAEEYVATAVKVASDASRLAQWRQSMRERMQHSPVMDAGGYAAAVEAAYRQMWRSWCQTNLPPA